uniref:Uncharacterized protein n=1 Tax=Arundo donax TaxID=35708 RepID=A0A0A8ZLY9_ARUDO
MSISFSLANASMSTVYVTLVGAKPRSFMSEKVLIARAISLTRQNPAMSVLYVTALGGNPAAFIWLKKFKALDIFPTLP